MKSISVLGMMSSSDKLWCYNEYGPNSPEGYFVCIKGKDILDIYWDTWKNNCEKKLGKDHPSITEEDCIQDWVVINWAWEVE